MSDSPLKILLRYVFAPPYAVALIDDLPADEDKTALRKKVFLIPTKLIRKMSQTMTFRSKSGLENEKGEGGIAW